MPRNVSGVFSLVPGTAAASGDTIRAADYNALTQDIAADLNAPRPVTSGGTGSTNMADARTNLGATTVGDALFTAADAPAAKTTLALDQVDNTSDAAKNSAAATLTNKTLTSPTINGGTISDIADLAVADGGTGASDATTALTNLGLSGNGKALVTAATYAAMKTLLSLSNVDNTSDATKPISTATATALAAKASLGADVSFRDITANRGDGTGAILLGGATHYLYFDGTYYRLAAGELLVNGSQVWHAGNFNPATKVTVDAIDNAGLSSANLEAPYMRRASDAAISWLATKNYVETRVATKAGINDQTTTSATVFPIGTYLVGYNAAIDRAQTTTMSLFNTDNKTYSIPASAAALAGTWRACGSWGGNLTLMQRVA